MAETPLPIRIAQTLGITTSSAIGGSVLTISFLLVPRLLESPTPLMLKQWRSSFNNGKATVPPLAGLASASYFYLAYKSHQLAGADSLKWKLYLIAGILSVGIVPYTLLAMFPTNRKLLVKAEETTKTSSYKDDVLLVLGEESPHMLVDKWGVLNLGRGVMLTLSGLLGAWAALA